MLARGTLHIAFTPIFIGILIIAISIFTSSYYIYLFGGLVILLGIFLLIFFRDPVRKIGKGIVSPADGKVIEVNRGLNRISIFMGIQNVHVNRAPVGGIVTSVKHFRGSHVPAFKKESERNERVETRMRTKLGEVRIVQIAGIVARRIVPYIRTRMKLRKGQRIGVIKLGSRVDVYLPETVRILAKVGHKVYAGESQIGEEKHEVD
jgi:phosphatidylserine decarboxylase